MSFPRMSVYVCKHATAQSRDPILNYLLEPEFGLLLNISIRLRNLLVSDHRYRDVDGHQDEIFLLPKFRHIGAAS